MRLSLQWGLSAAAIPVGAALAIVAGSGWEGAVHPSAPVRYAITSRIFLFETALTILAAPLAGVMAVLSSSGASAFVRRLAISVTILAATSMGIALALRAPLDAGTLAAAHSVLGTTALALAALGAVCATVFREPLDAIACALVIALMSTVGLLGLGPLLETVPRRPLEIALILNPFVAAAASFNIDIFRTEPLYQLSPLAHTQFDYPATATTVAWYGFAALAMLLGAAIQLRRLVNVRLIERMSA